MRRGRLRWFGHVERKDVDDWVSACRNLSGGQQRQGQAKDDLESSVGWGYEGYGAKARDDNRPREVEVWHHGENV